MKKLLTLIFIILPIFSVTNKTIISENIDISSNISPIENKQTYNQDIVKYLENSIINKSFDNGGKYFDKEVIVYSYSLEKFTTMSKIDVIKLFNDMVKSNGHSYEIYHHTDDDDNNVYTMKYFYKKERKTH